MTSSQQDATSAILSGYQWSGPQQDGRLVITYSFAGAQSVYSDLSAGFRETSTAFSVADQQVTRELLAAIEAVCNVQFQEVPDGAAGHGDVRYSYSQRPNDLGLAGYAFFPSSLESGGDVWIGAEQAGLQWEGYRPFLILHETLHALGLQHPHDGEAISDTVMSDAPFAGSAHGVLSLYPTEPMLLDVQALQQLYGAAQSNLGDTRYDLGDSAFAGLRSLWDAGGNDTLDASGCVAGVTIDLRSGTHSSVGTSVSGFAYEASGTVQGSLVDTLSIAPGCVLENAIGSNFNDVLHGNEVANTLSGLDGDDLFIIGSGYATIIGGAGDDSVQLGGVQANYAVSNESGYVAVRDLSDGRAVARLSGVEHLVFADASVDLAPMPAPTPVSALDPGAETPQSTAITVARLYQAAFGRLPDAEGMAFHSASLMQSHDLGAVADSFLASPEFNVRYGLPGDQAYVSQLYANVLGRTPDAQGMAYYLDLLADGSADFGVLLVGFAQSPENRTLFEQQT